MVSTEGLRQKRKYAIVVAFVTAAILTPPDVISQVLLAVPIIAFAAPVTSVLLKPSSFPPCIALAKAHPHDPDGCFLIDTYPARGYFLAVAAVVLWLICGVDGGPTHKYIHAKLEPADAPPPTCRP